MNSYPLPRVTPKSWERGSTNLAPRPLPPSGATVIQRQLTPRNTPSNQYPGAILFGRNFQGNSIIVGTSPVLLLEESCSRPALILNTTRQTGQTKAVSGFSGTLAAAGTTQATPVNCAGYETAHLHLTISAIAGTWDIYTQSYDSLQGVWYDSQMVYNALALTTDSGYDHIGTLGVAEQLAFRFDPTAPGAITAELTVTLKGGTGTGLLSSLGIVHLGNRSVNPVSGFPLLPSQYQIFQLEEGTQMWGISDTSGVVVKTFLL
jgi:hypothetical protein